MKKSTKFLLAIIALAIIFCSIVFILTFFTEKNSNNNDNTGVIKEESSKDGSGASLAYSNIVSINKETKTVELYVKNPGKSTQNIQLDVVIFDNNKEITVASSDVVENGYTIYTLDLKDVDLTKSKYDGQFIIKYFDRKTNNEQMVNTKIDIKVKVK